MDRRRQHGYFENKLNKNERVFFMNMTIKGMWDYLMEAEIATEEELQLITAINGYNKETLCDVLYVRTGYRSFDQLEEEVF